jgi:hypothetical protein
MNQLNDIAELFSELASKASVGHLESILVDIVDWDGPIADKVRCIVNQYLAQKQHSGNEKDHLRYTLAGTETIH